MSARQWSDGDVAAHAGERVAFGDREWRWLTTGLRCHHQAYVYAAARPLLVLDPEDREQMGRLWSTVYDASLDGLEEHDYEAAAAAVRSLLALPRPDEPTGLGAVVEASCVHHDDRQVWVRVADGQWQPRHGKSDDWDSLRDPRVLSPGYTPDADA